jgi:quinol monooxygenase YgiN
MPVLIAGTIRLPPGSVDAARPAMAAMVAASRAEAGCLAYSYAEDVLEPGLVHVLERWTDDAALATHFATPHLAEWRAAWPALGITDRRLTRYRVDEGSPT